MTSLKCRTLIVGLLGVTMLLGCAMTPQSTAPQEGASATPAELAGKSLDLRIQASGENSATGWTKADIDKYVITLADSEGQSRPAVVLQQTGLSNGQTPLSEVKFKNLRHGETYTITVEAWNGSQIINRHNPSTVTFTFTGTQDVEDLKTLPIVITLDDRQFSGTVKIPMTKEFFRGVFGNNGNYFTNSTQLTWKLDRIGEPETLPHTYPKPASGYKNYLLTNLGYGFTYKLTLTNHYKDGNEIRTQTKFTKEFKPFENPSSNPEYLLKIADFE